MNNDAYRQFLGERFGEAPATTEVSHASPPPVAVVARAPAPAQAETPTVARPRVESERRRVPFGTPPPVHVVEAAPISVAPAAVAHPIQPAAAAMPTGIAPAAIGGRVQEEGLSAIVRQATGGATISPADEAKSFGGVGGAIMGAQQADPPGGRATVTNAQLAEGVARPSEAPTRVTLAKAFCAFDLFGEQ